MYTSRVFEYHLIQNWQRGIRGIYTEISATTAMPTKAMPQ